MTDIGRGLPCRLRLNFMELTLPPEQSVRDALIDLQAHQLGMIAGIQALIAAMLQSFNPERLEEEARHEGAVPRLALPSSRKAALWDHFVKSYQKTSGELEDEMALPPLFITEWLHNFKSLVQRGPHPVCVLCVNRH